MEDLKAITTKDIQKLLKIAMNKTTTPDFNKKLGIENFDKNNITKFRHHCKNVKLRHIYYRLISRDFFTMEKMLKYKMTATDRCQRCNEKETYKHLLWECEETKKVWKSYNEYLAKIKYEHGKIEKYEDIFSIQDISALSIIKMKIIKEMIQITRPTGWTLDNVEKIAKELKNIELYYSLSKHCITKNMQKWNRIK